LVFGLHIVPIIISTVIGFALGALWFSPALFGNVWKKLLEKYASRQIEHNNLKMFCILALLVFVFNVGMEMIVDKANASTMNDGVVLGIIIGLGVSSAHIGIVVIMEQKPKFLLAMYSAYYLLISVISASLMAMWK